MLHKTLDECNAEWRKQGYTTIRKASDGDGDCNVNFEADGIFLLMVSGGVVKSFCAIEASLVVILHHLHFPKQNRLSVRAVIRLVTDP